jgi:membrane AbrB-like protein
MERYLFVILAGLAGAYISIRLSIPGGAVVGSMLGSGLMAVLLPEGVVLVPRLALAIQVILGISLGLTFDRSFLSQSLQILPLAVLSTVILLLVAFCMAFIASRLGLIDFGTALFGFSPGGMSGMAILAKTEGFQPAIVAFLHVVRIFTLFVTVPLMVRIFLYFRQ